jgi:hypothetical protein
MKNGNARRRKQEEKRKNNLLNSLVRDFPAVVSHETFLLLIGNSLLCLRFRWSEKRRETCQNYRSTRSIRRRQFELVF